MKVHYTIGEIANIYKISTDSLRLYEKMGLLVPDRAENGYRTYSIFDAWRLNVIKTMKSLGIPLKDIKAFLENRSVAGEIDLLEREGDFIEEEIKTLSYQRAHIQNRISLLKEAQDFNQAYQVIYKDLPSRRVAYIQSEVRSDDEVDLAYTKLTSHKDQKIYFFNRDFAMVLDLDQAKKGNFNHYSTGFLVITDPDQAYDELIPGGTYLVLRYPGPYKNVARAYRILFDEIKKKNLKTGPSFIERYIVDINLTDQEEEYLTEIQIRLL